MVGNLVGFVFAAATLIYSFVSFPMVVDKPVDGLTALTVSLRAVAANPRMTAAWGLQVAGLLLIGALPAFIGLAAVSYTHLARNQTDDRGRRDKRGEALARRTLNSEPEGDKAGQGPELSLIHI